MAVLDPAVPQGLRRGNRVAQQLPASGHEGQRGAPDRQAVALAHPGDVGGDDAVGPPAFQLEGPEAVGGPHVQRRLAGQRGRQADAVDGPPEVVHRVPGGKARGQVDRVVPAPEPGVVGVGRQRVHRLRVDDRGAVESRGVALVGAPLVLDGGEPTPCLGQLGAGGGQLAMELARSSPPSSTRTSASLGRDPASRLRIDPSIGISSLDRPIIPIAAHPPRGPTTLPDHPDGVRCGLIAPPARPVNPNRPISRPARSAPPRPPPPRGWQRAWTSSRWPISTRV